ncbi:MAG TPA: hypothetical protein VME70_09170, partial [Mycobacteriales bacterium]|nr:hypothetical protein [Mycobacteriales bacterium]
SLRAGPPEVAEPAAAMPAAARQARERAMPAREGVRERAAKIVPERVRETAAVPRTRPAELQERREVLFDQTMPGYVASDDVEPTRYEPEPIEMARTAEPALEPLFDQTAPVGPVEQRETAAAYAAPDEFVFDQTAVFDDDHPTVEIDRYAEPVFDQTAEPVESRRSAEPADGELFFDLDTPQAPAAQAVTPEPEPGIGGAEWDPVPVPPPTYVNKPTAPARRARPPIFEPLLPPAETPEELDPVDNLEEILDRRWAVND